jgi:phosphoglycerol transferase MdoB-like AlkP superfamily enzyme
MAFFIACWLLLFTSAAEYFFFDEFGTRFNFIAVDYIVYTHEVIGNIRESYPLVPILSILTIIAGAITLGLRTQLMAGWQKTVAGRHRKLALTLLILPLIAWSVVTIRWASFSKNSYVNEIAGNGIYCLIAAFYHNELEFTKYYQTTDNKQVLAQLKNLIREPNNSFVHDDRIDFTRAITNPGPTRKLNVIVVVEESLSAEYLGTFGNKKGLTPNLDRLARESLLFTHLYATGTRTVRGLEALTLSIPPLPGTSIVKRPNNENFDSWGSIMRDQGYDTKFIYGGFGYFDNMNYFFAHNGFSVVDRHDMDKSETTFANAWGVCDEDLFRRVIREANASKKEHRPFFSLVMTTSNHRPFTFPDGAIDLPSKTSGRSGGVKYADHAIGRLIEVARKEPWFKDTIFVIVADHCASSAGKTDLPVKRYEIPLIVYAPHYLAPRVIDRTMSQIDVAPTILGLLNMSYSSKFLGRDILKADNAPERAFISTYQKLGYIQDNHLVVLSPQKKALLYRFDRATGASQPIPMEELYLANALGYYQGADYIYQHKLNRRP